MKDKTKVQLIKELKEINMEQGDLPLFFVSDGGRRRRVCRRVLLEEVHS